MVTAEIYTGPWRVGVESEEITVRITPLKLLKEVIKAGQPISQL